MANLIGFLIGFIGTQLLFHALRKKLNKQLEQPKVKCPPHAWQHNGNKMVCSKCRLSPFEGPLDAKGPDYDN